MNIQALVVHVLSLPRLVPVPPRRKRGSPTSLTVAADDEVERVQSRARRHRASRQVQEVAALVLCSALSFALDAQLRSQVLVHQSSLGTSRDGVRGRTYS